MTGDSGGWQPTTRRKTKQGNRSILRLVEIRGKAHDDALMMHDFAPMDWTGANSFGTSHYPYAEEVLDYADRHGIVVIDETAAAGLNVSLGLSRGMTVPAELFSEEAVSSRTQATHLQAIRELIARDRNHPCVAM